ncbi:hypothetical protein CRG98_018433 [Punica granatum]|uniref:Uncharacterized protein n=1 Tax=Punica granatum TaxID=22663 RepID=A0A2I0JY65_PUNGR|nr:hypothetical protein CRG98_018433 [Punica granatum]
MEGVGKFVLEQRPTLQGRGKGKLHYFVLLICGDDVTAFCRCRTGKSDVGRPANLTLVARPVGCRHRLFTYTSDKKLRRPNPYACGPRVPRRILLGSKCQGFGYAIADDDVRVTCLYVIVSIVSCHSKSHTLGALIPEINGK